MSSDLKIEVVDAQVRALPVTLASPRRRKAWLQVVGEGVVERIKRRSETSTEPDDQQCKSNAASTIAMRPTSDPRRLSRLESYFLDGLKSSPPIPQSPAFISLCPR